MIPSWSNDPAIGNRLINARSETVAEKPSFRAAFRQRRCLVVADGFYEWQQAGASRKQPYLFRLHDGSPFAFVGLWERCHDLETCTILTTTANELLRPVHDRMPVIVAPRDYQLWLDTAVKSSEPLLPILRPYPAEQMTACRVTPHVNNPKHDDPECIEPAV